MNYPGVILANLVGQRRTAQSLLYLAGSSYGDNVVFARCSRHPDFGPGPVCD